jgi:hypothetical protein
VDRLDAGEAEVGELALRAAVQLDGGAAVDDGAGDGGIVEQRREGAEAAELSG